MRRLVLPLLAANAGTFAAIGISYLVYSRVLTPEEFGIYTAGLAVGAFAILVLDGGIKTGVIKRPADLGEREAGGLLLALMGIAGFLLALVAAAAVVPRAPWLDAPHGDAFVIWFAALHVATYPWIGISTAMLERKLLYSQLARIEGAATILERAAPALLLMVTDWGLWSFVVALAAGRLLRVGLLLRLAPVRPRVADRANTLQMLREGFWFQLGSAASVVRDNLHVLLAGPVFGPAWVGFYGWALQLCMMASQAFVQISARITLPLTAQAATHDERRSILLIQVRTLATVTAPILACVTIIAPWMNDALFQAKWTPALPILGLLCLRMIPGVACAPLGPIVLVEGGTHRYAIALLWWTGVEALAAAIALYLVGPPGLALSGALMAWAGIWLLVRESGSLARSGFTEIAAAILSQPCVAVSVAFGVGMTIATSNGALPQSLPWSILWISVLLGICLTADKGLRRILVDNTAHG